MGKTTASIGSYRETEAGGSLEINKERTDIENNTERPSTANL